MVEIRVEPKAKPAHRSGGQADAVYLKLKPAKTCPLLHAKGRVLLASGFLEEHEIIIDLPVKAKDRLGVIVAGMGEGVALTVECEPGCKNFLFGCSGI